MTAAALLHQVLEQRLDAAAATWMRESVVGLAGGGSDRDLYRLVSLVSRKLGKAPLRPTQAEQAAAHAARPGWDVSRWTVDQAARVLLLLVTGADGERSVARLDALCATADVDELVAFYRGLPLYPDPPRHRARAAEGVRSNMKLVFEAVAHGNPYPAEQLADEAWNRWCSRRFLSAVHCTPSWVWTSAPTRRWHACWATTRTSAGPQAAASARNCGAASAPSPTAR